MDIRRYRNAQSAAEACAVQILSWLDTAILSSPNGLATLAISGGSSPALMFGYFSWLPFTWDRVHVFWVDERGVPPEDEQSNFRLARDTWFQKAGFPAANIHRIEAERPPLEAAELYEHEIRQFFDLADDQLPSFDVIHRGIGTDGHTASLFPGDPVIEDRSGIAAPVWLEEKQQWRITLLPGVLEAAQNTAILASGADKAEVIHRVLRGPADETRWPAQIGAREGFPVVWFLDTAAGAKVAVPQDL